MALLSLHQSALRSLHVEAPGDAAASAFFAPLPMLPGPRLLTSPFSSDGLVRWATSSQSLQLAGRADRRWSCKQLLARLSCSPLHPALLVMAVSESDGSALIDPSRPDRGRSLCR